MAVMSEISGKDREYLINVINRLEIKGDYEDYIYQSKNSDRRWKLFDSHFDVCFQDKEIHLSRNFARFRKEFVKKENLFDLIDLYFDLFNILSQEKNFVFNTLDAALLSKLKFSQIYLKRIQKHFVDVHICSFDDDKIVFLLDGTNFIISIKFAARTICRNNGDILEINVSYRDSKQKENVFSNKVHTDTLNHWKLSKNFEDINLELGERIDAYHNFKQIVGSPVNVPDRAISLVRRLSDITGFTFDQVLYNSMYNEFKTKFALSLSRFRYYTLNQWYFTYDIKTDELIVSSDKTDFFTQYGESVSKQIKLVASDVYR